MYNKIYRIKFIIITFILQTYTLLVKKIFIPHHLIKDGATFQPPMATHGHGHSSSLLLPSVSISFSRHGLTSPSITRLYRIHLKSASNNGAFDLDDSFCPYLPRREPHMARSQGALAMKSYSISSTTLISR
jgi:hypothetical protein